MKIYLLALIPLTVMQAATVTVPNTTQAAIVSSISSACNGTSSGTVIFPDGTYPIASTIHVPSNCTLQAQNVGGPILSANSNGMTILSIGSSHVTVNGLVLDGGALYAPAFPSDHFTITNNTFRNIVSQNGASAGLTIEQGTNGLIDNNAFSNLWAGGYESYPSGVGYNGQCCVGIRFWHSMSSVTISNNRLDKIGNDGINFGQGGGSQLVGSNNIVAYNTLTHIHRYGMEMQEPVGNIIIKGNYIHDFASPWTGQWPLSLPLDTQRNLTAMNNTAVYNLTSAIYCPGNLASMFELGGAPWLIQGNVAASIPKICTNSMWKSWLLGSVGSGNSTSSVNIYQNNIWCGNSDSVNSGVEVPLNQQAQQLEQYDYKNSTGCPANNASPGAGLNVSNMTVAFTSANNQSFPSGGNGTWNNSVISNLSIKWVQFFVDGSTTPITTQEPQDVNTNFSNDRKWLYHATINTSGLSAGNHTITVKATDVSGASQSVTQNFTVGSGGPPPPPTISSFVASPASVLNGGASTLSWVSSGGTACSIGGIGAVTCGSASVVVHPSATTSYLLTVGNSTGSVTRTVTVTVTIPAPTIDSFTATPAIVNPGGSSTLSWSTTGATSVSINQGIGTVPNSGTLAVNPLTTTTYVITATNPGGSPTRSVTVSILTSTSITGAAVLGAITH